MPLYYGNRFCQHYSLLRRHTATESKRLQREHCAYSHAYFFFIFRSNDTVLNLWKTSAYSSGLTPVLVKDVLDWLRLTKGLLLNVISLRCSVTSEPVTLTVSRSQRSDLQSFPWLETYNNKGIRKWKAPFGAIFTRCIIPKVPVVLILRNTTLRCHRSKIWMTLTSQGKIQRCPPLRRFLLMTDFLFFALPIR